MQMRSQLYGQDFKQQPNLEIKNPLKQLRNISTFELSSVTEGLRFKKVNKQTTALSWSG